MFLSEISSSEQINETFHGRIGLMIRSLDLGGFRRSVKERVRSRAADPFVKQNEQRAGTNPFVGESIRVGRADALA